MGIGTLFERSPWLEIAVKGVYWRLARFPRLKARLLQLRKSTVRAPGQGAAAPVDFGRVIDHLRQSGVREGDILIVHSSVDALARTGLTQRAIIEALRGLVGTQGTLAMPAIPIIKGQPAGLDLFNDAAFEPVLSYDVQRSPPWTGVLPKALMRTEGAVRSRHPGNTMVAIGPHALDMMRDNLSSPDPTPCGAGSSWDYCHRHDAKIAAIGVDLAHSVTMVHVAEDAFEDSWPVRGWYRHRRYRIIDGDFDAVVRTRERRHHWSIFFAERALARDLRVSGVAPLAQVEGLDVSVCSSRRLIDFVRNHRRRAYPYCIPFLGLRNWLHR